MGNTQKKLVSSIYKLWEAAQKDGKSVFINKSLYAFAPPLVDHLDLYRGILIRVFVEGEELPVMGFTIYRNLGDK